MSSMRAIARAVCLVLVGLLGWVPVVSAQSMGGIRGTVSDQDFDVPLFGTQILITETGMKATSTEEGNYVFGEIPPGTYTLVFSKEGYTRQYKPNVVVAAGQMTEVNISLPGEFTEMEEFVVQDLELGGSSELGLLNLRMESPALMDSVSADLMSQAGASDAAGALKLVSGATVQDGKYAVVRGLPDRYVSSQLNGVRLPTADADKRAVELDQFPAAVVESIQVSKTFTPEQQGDASGGAVNVVTKGIPEETTFKVSAQIGYNSQTTGNDDFLTYEGGGVNFWGFDDGRRDIQYDNIGSNWDGAVGVSRDKAPTDYKWSISGGTKHDLDNGITIGGFGSLFYERDSSYHDGGINDEYWVETPGAALTPQYVRGTPAQGDFKTKLFDVTQGSQEVKWGTLATVGAELNENHSLSLLYMYTHVAEDVATLAEDTRSKASLHTFWPEHYGPEYANYNPGDPCHPGNTARDAAPYLRTETLEYTERDTQTVQLSGEHLLPLPEWGREGFFHVKPPTLDWVGALSSAGMKQPDKRQFGSLWWAESYSPGFPPFVPPGNDPAVHEQFKPAANFTLGNLQRVWKEISEESKQYNINLTFPFEQWNDREGSFALGHFNDQVEREYKQESFSNFNDNTGRDQGDPEVSVPFDDYWSAVFPAENHPISDGPPFVDVDYDGDQKIKAFYSAVDLPVTSKVNVIGGLRWEQTDLSILNHPEENATWVPPGSSGSATIDPDKVNVSYQQRDVLPSLGALVAPWEWLTVRATYSETVARQTFKELTPIQQMEFLGGDVFVGNPFLRMSALKNYDLRVDYTPYQGGLVSLSYFYKDIKDPIEYVQRVADFVYTTPVNYPKGRLSGWEFEVRQDIGHFKEALTGLSVGANVTLIDSEVTLSEEEQEEFNQPNIQQPMSTRDMTDAPKHLYNLFTTYEIEDWGTKLGLFYTVKGDTLVAGAGQSNGKYVPSVYSKEYGTLNLSVTQRLAARWSLKFQAKNITNPKIQRVYKHTNGDRTKSSYKRGIDLSLSMAYSF